MKKLCSILLFTCVQTIVWAQVNFVKNPSFEEYYKCPDDGDRLTYAKFWTNIIDTSFSPKSGTESEYYNRCALGIHIAGSLPENSAFYQDAHTGDGIAGAAFYFDKTPSPSPPVANYREYLNGRLHAKLQAGKTYCVTFYLNLMETSGYAQNKIGAYFDDGSIHKLSIPMGSEVTTLTPQVYTSDVISDTMNWIKVEGSFVASGNEKFITIGTFFKNADVTANTVPYVALFNQYSYYLIDDVSVIPIDLDADAGKDNWVELGKQVKIGRVGDTTAMGLDCKWYKKGVLIDSGAIISVNASSIKNAIDTYVVVQTICGNVKTDTVLVKTTGVGIPLLGGARGGFSIYPNPSSGTISITSLHAVLPTKEGTIQATVYDLLGRIVHQEPLSFSNKEATFKLNIPTGSYILELQDEDGNVQRERIVIE